MRILLLLLVSVLLSSCGWSLTRNPLDPTRLMFVKEGVREASDYRVHHRYVGPVYDR